MQSQSPQCLINKLNTLEVSVQPFSVTTIEILCSPSNGISVAVFNILQGDGCGLIGTPLSSQTMLYCVHIFCPTINGNGTDILMGALSQIVSQQDGNKLTSGILLMVITFVVAEQPVFISVTNA